MGLPSAAAVDPTACTRGFANVSLAGRICRAHASFADGPHDCLVLEFDDDRQAWIVVLETVFSRRYCLGCGRRVGHIHCCDGPAALTTQSAGRVRQTFTDSPSTPLGITTIWRTSLRVRGMAIWFYVHRPIKRTYLDARSTPARLGGTPTVPLCQVLSACEMRAAPLRRLSHLLIRISRVAGKGSIHDAGTFHGLAPSVETSGFELLQNCGLPHVERTGRFGSAYALVA